MTRTSPLTRPQAKARLRRLGWSYRRVAPLLGVGHVHLAQVMRGARESRRIMQLIAGLAPCPPHAIPPNSPLRRTS